MSTTKNLDLVKAKLPPWEIPTAKLPPHTNRGGKGQNITVDYLTVTFRIGTHLQRFQTYMSFMLIEALLSCHETVEFRSTKRNSYKFGKGAYLAGKELAVMCWGGNMDTFMIEIKGGMCRFIKPEQWRRLLRFLEKVASAKITRCDVAVDFFQGELCARCAWDVWRSTGAEFLGIARKYGRLPKGSWVDGGVDGSTLYIGRGTRREICIYEKGRQLGFFDEPWVRAEVRYRHYKSGMKVYKVPLDILEPDNWWSYWAASADYLAQLTALAKSVKYGPLELQYDDFLSYLKQQAWHCRNQYGGLIGFLTSMCGSAFTCRLLSRSGWAGVDLFPAWDNHSPKEIKSVLEAIPAVLEQ